ncbi:hypothetical protein BHE74_00041247, partial [Ensete ventricosum]
YPLRPQRDSGGADSPLRSFRFQGGFRHRSQNNFPHSTVRYNRFPSRLLDFVFPVDFSWLGVLILGLEVLIELDSRFRSYKDSLFSQTSLELNREKMVPKEEEKVNRSICSYLRLLSGYLHLHAALKTLEYLIRRYL